MRLREFLHGLNSPHAFKIHPLADVFSSGAGGFYFRATDRHRIIVTPYPSSWDERYRSQPAPNEPSELLVSHAGLLPRYGRALDVASGGGRNSVYLAERGLQVVAVDASREALEQGRELARRHRVRVEWFQADLGQYPLPRGRFEIVTCFYYRDAALYASIRQALAPGGLLYYETYTQEQLRLGSGPRNPEHLLRPQELLQVFGDWRLVYYRESWQGRAVASLIARKPD